MAKERGVLIHTCIVMIDARRLIPIELMALDVYLLTQNPKKIWFTACEMALDVMSLGTAGQIVIPAAHRFRIVDGLVPKPQDKA